MSRTFGLVTAAALLASVTAFAQTPATTTDTSAAPASDTAKPDDAAPAKPMHKHHKMTSMNKGTDWSADKLNACMSNATPTASQESCLKEASGKAS